MSRLTVVRMLVSSARRSAPHRLGGVPAAALVLGLALLLTGCADDEKAAPAPAPTPIAELDTAAMQVPRIEFCSLVPAAAVTRALGGKPGARSAYGNGDEVELPGAGKDVGHEIGCTWSTQPGGTQTGGTGPGSTAKAWVFARPVNEQLARTVIASGRRTPGCRTVAGPAYGEPSATQRCTLPGGAQRVRHSGLFDQTWLTCELATAGPEQDPGQDPEQAGLRARTDRWCVEVANALNGAQ